MYRKHHVAIKTIESYIIFAEESQMQFKSPSNILIIAHIILRLTGFISISPYLSPVSPYC